MFYDIPYFAKKLCFAKLLIKRLQTFNQRFLKRSGQGYYEKLICMIYMLIKVSYPIKLYTPIRLIIVSSI